MFYLESGAVKLYDPATNVKTTVVAKEELVGLCNAMLRSSLFVLARAEFSWSVSSGVWWLTSVSLSLLLGVSGDSVYCSAITSVLLWRGTGNAAAPVIQQNTSVQTLCSLRLLPVHCARQVSVCTCLCMFVYVCVCLCVCIVCLCVWW